MTNGLILALGFIFFVWLIPVLFIWIESKGGYISIKGGKVPSRYGGNSGDSAPRKLM